METTERMKGITYEMGFVYCLFDKSFNVYKIGKTSDYPSKRNQQLFSTGMLYPLEYEFSIYIKNPLSDKATSFPSLVISKSLIRLPIYICSDEIILFLLSLKTNLNKLLPARVATIILSLNCLK